MVHYYVVINTVDIVDSMLCENICGGTTYRKSLDETQVILKFCTPYPETMGGYLKRTHTEILQFLDDNSAAWILPPG